MKVSIIVPVYNEENRIKPFITDMENFMKKLKNYELIFVDDGSRDGTLNILRELAKKHRSVRIMTYKENRGKGYAIKKGVMAANGKKVIFIDADGSIRPKEIKNMLPLLDKYDVVVGDRTHYESNVNQPLLRKITGKLFNLYVNVLFGVRIRDNLCGFKGFKNNIGKVLFRNQLSDKWIFDVEMFYKIRKNNYSMNQMSIKWEHKKGTKIKFFDPFKMFLQLAMLRAKLSRSK
jgi:dolichyl-phosphate beta-glucosyltransferase